MADQQSGTKAVSIELTPKAYAKLSFIGTAILALVVFAANRLAEAQARTVVQEYDLSHEKEHERDRADTKRIENAVQVIQQDVKELLRRK